MIFKLKNNFIQCDAAESWQLLTQDPATPTFEGMIYFHNYLTFFIVVIGTFVFWILYRIINLFNEKVNPISHIFTHSSVLEIIWTVIPALILLIIAVPSFSLLYSLDEVINPIITLKVIGHQWYWTYEYSDFVTMDKGQVIEYDSYMLPINEVLKYRGALRLLESDRRVVLPINTHIRVLVTAADVLHSWAVPSFGIKIDACPGRLSQTGIYIKREGTYYGQCSEICGINHGFMPIVVRAVPVDRFTSWIAKELDTKST